MIRTSHPVATAVPVAAPRHLCCTAQQTPFERDNSMALPSFRDRSRTTSPDASSGLRSWSPPV